MKEAAEFGVRIHVCEMSMGVMGLKEEEMIDYPGIDYVGVGSVHSDDQRIEAGCVPLARASENGGSEK